MQNKFNHVITSHVACSGSSYFTTKLISTSNKKPVLKESKRIETLMHSVVQKRATWATN